MKEEAFTMKLEVPEFVQILDETIRKEVLEEVEEKIRPELEKEFRLTAREIISKKLELMESEEKETEKKEAPKPEKKTKHCPKCNKEIDKDARFCRFCGAKL
ncbi:MAG: zinc ribbon domain-containing protein [Euryarchaeota archaeon]|nr:zinc ribbon domain-containing protein [Euryarchaeota archaeon]